MRGVSAILFVVGGIALTVRGLDGITDDGSGIGSLIGGIVLLFLGIMTIRAMSTQSTDAPIPSAEMLGDHPLVDMPAPDETQTRSAPTERSQPRTSPAGSSAARRVLVLVAALGVGIAGAIAAFVQVDTPNVPPHILSACHDALLVSEGAGASFGMVVNYEAVGISFQEIDYETSQGWTWTCTYNTETGTATASAVNRG